MSTRPWQQYGATVYQLDGSGTNLWSAHVSGPRFSFGDAAKVAQKMAAAPDMYEALDAIVYWHETAGHVDESWIDAARAALVKARGQ